MLTVDPADPHDDGAVAASAALMTEVWAEVLGDGAQPPITFEEMADWLRNTAVDTEVLLWLARDAGEPVGLALLDVRTGRGNDHRAWVPDIWVRPAARRRGAGRLLLEAVVAAARARGRTLLAGGHQEPHDGAAAFVAAVGGTYELADDQNRVAVADLDRALLASWVADAPDGYSLVAWDDRCPDDLVGAFARLQDVMNTAPMPAGENPTIVTPDIVRDNERRLANRGGTMWWLAARHDATGELAGYTEILFSPNRPWMAAQGDTGVAVPHRGHGIGRWLKAVNALRLLDEHPEVALIETWNASSNEHMLAINHAMGFRRVSQWRSVNLAL